MSEPEQGQEPELEDIEVPDPPAQDAAPDPAVEAEARKYGWRPKEEYSGNQQRWRPADIFMDMPSTHVKILRDELKAVRGELAGTKNVTETVAQRVRDQERQRYDAELEALRAAKREAAESADLPRFDALEAREARMRPPQEPVIKNDVAEYVSKAEWAKDPVMMDFARRAIDADPLAQAMGPTVEQVKWAEAKLKDYFPHKFQAPAPTTTRQTISRVDGGSLAAGARRGKSAADLPADAVAVGKEFVAKKYFKSLDDYAASYFSQPGV